VVSSQTKPRRDVFDLGLCSDCTLPTCPEDRKECWHSQCENKYLKIGFGLLNLLCQHKQNPSRVCVLRVHVVAFTILACVIWKPSIGGVLNWKLKPENKTEVKLLHSYYCYIPLFFLNSIYYFFFPFMFLHIPTADGMFATPLGSSNPCPSPCFLGRPSFEIKFRQFFRLLEKSWKACFALELPPCFLAVARSWRLVLVTWCICRNAAFCTDGWTDWLLALHNGEPWEPYFAEQDLQQWERNKSPKYLLLVLCMCICSCKLQDGKNLRFRETWLVVLFLRDPRCGSAFLSSPSLYCWKTVSPFLRPFPHPLGPPEKAGSDMLDLDSARFICLRPNRELRSGL